MVGRTHQTSMDGGTRLITAAITNDYWVGAREHQALDVKNNGTPVTAYEVAIAKHPNVYTEADWHSATSFDGALGVWVEDTFTAGTYRIWARVGNGAPNERAIVFCGFINVRSR
jgi:hypothetical protein